MKFTLNNRFKSLVGGLLAINMMLAAPTFASIQDTATVATQTEQAAVAAPADSAATTVADSAVAPAATDSTTVAAASSSSSSSTAAAAPKEEKKIDPQVYKNLMYYVFILLIACAVVGVIFKVLSIYSLTKRVNGKYNPLAGNTVQAVLLFVFLIGFLAFTYYGYAVWGSWAWRDAVTEHGKDIDRMFIITTVIITIVLVLVHILLMTFSLIYRMRAKRTAYYYPHNDAIERLWTIIPAVVLTVLVLFGFFTWRSITNIPEDLKKSALQIEVLGEQFQWTVRYPGNDGQIGKRNYKLTTPTNSYGIDFNDKSSWDDVKGDEIVIPVNKPVRFHIMSKDIIHSFFIPDFRVQINAVPGMTNYFQFTPTVTTEEMRDRQNDPAYDFYMLCAKICGSSHYNMKKKVIVVSEAEYKEWLSKQAKFFTEDLQKEFAQKEDNTVKESRIAASVN
ncbi:cytochrome c oxidase subunit II [Sphingobacterium sp. DK4209]|uniref:Cytochrome c oxidase subunit 2 n=1 Tax=Sphingobacterium zhuxiongii TaxID=2662364 RepID=A0A5Q0Q6W7_9SPHI|nr:MULTISPECIES: cytochrome c oxidase subunit II [unclassified Sphingobacterium]MVZ64868.1 cytochrome c oxidase subunit II [Sphingobacterium sp. DK4209]QGA25213.1 cytochrome c oxidase subunit II [Sphingobacterium sp. dk4302]